MGLQPQQVKAVQQHPLLSLYKHNSLISQIETVVRIQKCLTSIARMSNRPKWWKGEYLRLMVIEVVYIQICSLVWFVDIKTKEHVRISKPQKHRNKIEMQLN